jgi:hypothetical protein
VPSLAPLPWQAKVVDMLVLSVCDRVVAWHECVQTGDVTRDANGGGSDDSERTWDVVWSVWPLLARMAAGDSFRQECQCELKLHYLGSH